MLEKAIVIATAAIDHILSLYPADHPRYADVHQCAKPLLARFGELMKELKAQEHEQKSSAFPDKCPCRSCNPEAKADGELMEQCVKEAVEQSITGLEVVYDAETGKDETGIAEETVPMLLPNLVDTLAETTKNTLSINSN
jgi:hypothetical protein